MKRRFWMHFLILIGMLLISLACSLSLGPDQEDEEDLRLQLTLQAMQMTQAAFSSKAADEQVAPQQPQAPSLSGSDSKNSSNTEQDSTPCNASKFSSESIPDGTTFAPGEGFAKTWTLKNIGSCKWDENYVLEFEESTRMGGDGAVKLNTVIEPNETVTFKVNLEAPDAAGNYKGVWRLKSSSGEKLGKYWVVINVDNPAPDPAQLMQFAVTDVKMTNVIFPNQDNMKCTYTVTVEIEMTVTAPGTVTYNIGTGKQTINFESAGKKTFSTFYWIINPGHQEMSMLIYEPKNEIWPLGDIFAICE